jgi:hypothetical protein
LLPPRVVDDMLGCGRVVGFASDDGAPSTPSHASVDTPPQEVLVTARVGQNAPDFSAPSYHKGAFTPVKLSDFDGKWVTGPR